WTVTGIGGKPTISAARISLSIAPERRAGGNSGCNSYFTEASFENAPVRFGPIAATRMACGPEVMAQETALFEALAATTGNKASGRTLHLHDAAGVPLISLVRSP
ncbi:MAG: hypothetical protein JWP99_1428, partial [Devosia sp.]|nr:hypothetical protein [Devosia sp.]